MQSSLHDMIVELRRAIVIQRLNEHAGNASATARSLKIHRNTLDRICKESNIDIRRLKMNWQTAQTLCELRKFSKTEL